MPTAKSRIDSATEGLRRYHGSSPADRLLRAVVDSTVDGIVAIDAGGRVCFVNPAAVRLLDLPVEEVLGAVFPFPQHAGAITEVSVDRRDGTSSTLELRTSAVEADGEMLRVTDIRDVTDIVRLRSELEELSRTDDLTGLYNRRGFVWMAERYLRLADRSRCGVLVLFLDVDSLKQINDEHGHAAGDDALLRVATAICATMRSTDVLARVGGDEFAVASLNVSAGEVGAIRARVADALHVLCTDHETPCHVTVSMGAALYEPGSAKTVADLLAEADAGMYAEKHREPSPAAAPAPQTDGSSNAEGAPASAA